LQGLQPKTIAAYARAIRHLGAYFDERIDDLSEAQLTDYFSDQLQTHSWSTLKHRLYGLRFYYTHVLHTHSRRRRRSITRGGCGAPSRPAASRPGCSPARPWPRSFGPSCWRGSRRRVWCCPDIIPSDGSWTARPSAPEPKRWCTWAATCTGV
ncbi:MAG: hypothetical protein EPN69_06220, partial [Rhodanobacter sp.]